MFERARQVFRPLLVVAISAVVIVLPSTGVDAATTVYYRGAGAAPHISIIGDSTIAALRWTNEFEPLERFNFTYDAESCRRTVMPSCHGREGYTPDTTLQAMRRLSGQLGSVLFIMGGYDDYSYNFDSAVDQVMSEAMRQGVGTVVWLTLRSNVSYVGPGGISYAGTFRAINSVLFAKAIEYGPRLQIADWASYSAGQSAWFYADGIHFRPNGATAVATYIANQAALVLSGQLITPAAGRARPSAPRALTVAVAPTSGVGSGQVRLSWTVPSATGGVPIGDYTIQRSTNGTTWTTLNDGVSASVSSLVSGTNGTWYWFRVAARNSTGTGPWSNAVRVYPRALPSAPRSLVAAVAPTSGVGSGQVRLSWTVPASAGYPAIGDYTIQRSTNGTTWTTLNDGVNTRRSFLVSGGTNGTWYWFRVAARNSTGTGPWSNAVRVYPRALPSAPRSLVAAVAPTSGVGSGQVRLSWTVPASAGYPAIGDYTIQRSTNGTTWTTLNDGVNTLRSFLVSGGTNGTRYWFRVAARNSTGTGPWSNTVSARPGGATLATGRPDAPTSTSTTTTSTSTVPPSTSEPETTAPTSQPPVTPPEAPAASVGDLVWFDANGNGLQDEDGAGVGGVEVRLIDGSGAVVATHVTDTNGHYELAVASDGAFSIEVVLPDGYVPTLAGIGADESLDSDAEPSDVVVGALETTVRFPYDTTTQGDLDHDIGLIVNPDSTTTSTPAATSTPTSVVASPTTTTTPPTTTTPATTTTPPTTTTEAPTTSTATTEAPTTSAPATTVTSTPSTTNA